MSTTIQQTIDFSQTFIQYSPLSVGTGNQPAIGIANEIQNTMMNAPFTWPWNRNENSATSTVAGLQDYTFSITDFGFLEKVSLTDAAGNVWELLDVYNNTSLAVSSSNVVKRGRPNGASVLLVTYGTSFKLRFSCPPDAIYQIGLTYQKLVVPMTTLTGGTGTWTVPDQYLDIYNNLFLGEAMALVDDARANVYRQRGVAALLAKADGLTEMQKNVFLEQYWMRSTGQTQAAGLRTQQAAQARGN